MQRALSHVALHRRTLSRGVGLHQQLKPMISGAKSSSKMCSRFLTTTAASTTATTSTEVQPNIGDVSGYKINGKRFENPFQKQYDYNSLAHMQKVSCEKFKDKPFLGIRKGDGFEWMTFGEFGRLVDLCRGVLSKHGIGKGDAIAIISNNRIEWAVAYYAAASLGGMTVPMYEVQLEKDWQYILKDSGSKLLLVATEKIYEQTKGYAGSSDMPDLKSILSFEAEESAAHSFSGLMKKAATEAPVPAADVKFDDLVTIIYTSGTTGNPKGVELSHRNIMRNIQGSLLIAQEDDGTTAMANQRCLAFLPWAHIYGQTCDLHSMMCVGSCLALVSREQLVESFGVLKPTMVNSVPTLYNRIYDGVMKKVNQGSKVQQLLFHTALAVSRRRNEKLEFGLTPSTLLEMEHKLFDQLVFSKIRQNLGGQILGMTSGGAAQTEKVLKFFLDIGINLQEGYGLSETAPVVSFNGRSWKMKRVGTAGIIHYAFDVRILDPATSEDVPHGTDGEVCCSGESVMVGYHNNPAANAEVFVYKDGKRYFRTGDKGHIVDGRFLKITGRIKEQYKLENGKYVVPVAVEDALNRSLYISQSMVVGANKKFNVALIVPEFTEVVSWIKRHKAVPGFEDGKLSPKELIALPQVQQLFNREINKAAVSIKGYEKPLVWAPVYDPFTPENQLLTPKLSIRRNNVLKIYGEVIEGMYAGTAGFPVTPTKAKPAASTEDAATTATTEKGSK